MEQTLQHGQISILNGAPRSGKSSIVAEIQAIFDGLWMNLGVDQSRWCTPERYLPGIGLRPGVERQDLEYFIPVLYSSLYDSMAASSRLGLNEVIRQHLTMMASPSAFQRLAAMKFPSAPTE